MDKWTCFKPSSKSSSFAVSLSGSKPIVLHIINPHHSVAETENATWRTILPTFQLHPATFCKDYFFILDKCSEGILDCNATNDICEIGSKDLLAVVKQRKT